MRMPLPAAALAAALFLSGCQESSTTGSTSSTASATAGSSASATTPAIPDTGMLARMTGEKTMAGGLRYADLKVGDGPIVDVGITAAVHYTGWLTDGTKFDSSYDRGEPFPVKIGAVPRQVIDGWDQGLRGMRVGGKRRLIIPPELGYGARGYTPVIPPNATLVFEVQVVAIK